MEAIVRRKPRHVNPRYTAFARPRPPPSPAATSPASHRFRQPSSPISVSPVQNPRLSRLPDISQFRIRHSLAPSEPSEKSVVKPSAPIRPHPCLSASVMKSPAFFRVFRRSPLPPRPPVQNCFFPRIPRIPWFKCHLFARPAPVFPLRASVVKSPAFFRVFRRCPFPPRPPVQSPRLSRLPGISRSKIRDTLAPSGPSEKSLVKPSAPIRPHPCLRASGKGSVRGFGIFSSRCRTLLILMTF